MQTHDSKWNEQENEQVLRNQAVLPMTRNQQAMPMIRFMCIRRFVNMPWRVNLRLFQWSRV